MGTFNAQYFSSTAFWQKREVFMGLLDVTPENADLLDIFDMLGRAEEMAKNSQYHQFHMVDLFSTDTVNSVTDLSGGAGQGDIQIVVNAANGSSFAIKNSYVLFPSGYMGFVYDKTPDAGGDILKVKAVNPAVTTALLGVAGNQVISYPADGSGEGSGANSYRRWSPQKYDNLLGHLNNTIVEITDIADAEFMEFEVDGTMYAFPLLEIAGMRKFRMSEAFYLLSSQKSDPNFHQATPTLVDASGNPVQSTSGLDEQIDLYGIVDTGVTPDNAAFEALTLSFAARRAPTEYFLWAGQYGMNKLQNWAAGLSAANAVSDKIRFNVDGESVELNVMHVQVYGYDFYIKKVRALDHEGVFNYTGSAGFQKHVYFVPAGNTQTIDGKSVPYIRYRFLRGKNVNDYRYMMTREGALLSDIGHSRQGSLAATSIIGLEANGAQVFAKWELA